MLESAPDAICASPYGLGSDRVRTPSTVNALPGSRPTPHKLRHTYASILIALGHDPRYVMEQLGHTDPKFTLRVYAHVMRFSDDERAALKDLAEGRDWAALGSEAFDRAAPKRGASHGRGWARTSDLSRVRRALSH
jgi:hypothetical protein